MGDTFWLNDPSVLFNKHALELWPTPNLDYSAKLNAVSRLVIVLAILGYFFTRSIRILVTSAITLVVIVIIYKTQVQSVSKRKLNRKLALEGFTNPALQAVDKNAFTIPTQKNPLMNVLLPEIKYNPDRKAAAPAFNPEIEEDINNAAGNVGPDPRLFLDLGDNISFEQSMRNFYATPNTRIPNDQGAFARYCYGDMPSCRDGDGLQCVRDNHRWRR